MCKAVRLLFVRSFYMKSLREFYRHPEVLCGETESFSAECMLCACMLSRFSHADSATLWTVTGQSPLPMGFSRQEYRSALPCVASSEGSSRIRDRTRVSCASCIAWNPEVDSLPPAPPGKHPGVPCN